MKKGKDALSKFLTVFPVSFWMLVFVAIPLCYVIFISFMQRGSDGGIVYSPTIGNYTRMGSVLYLKIFWESLLIALVTTLLTILFGYPFAYFAAKLPKKYSTLILVLIMIPFWTNSLIRTYGWMVILRTQGIINYVLMSLHIIKEPLQMLYNWGAVLIGMIYTLFPFMVLPLYNSIGKMDRSYLEAAKDMGASKWTAFRTVTIPLTMPGIVSGCILVFIPSLGLFFITDLMGGGKTMLIGNLIKNQFLTSRDWPFGAALSIVLIVITLALIFVNSKAIGKNSDMGVF